MNKDEYKKRVAEMEARYNKERLALAKAYADANNPYSVGDILTNGTTIIKVERIRYAQRSGYSEFPLCIYEGTALKKDLTPRKVQPLRGQLYQTQVKEKLVPKKG